MKIKQRGCWQKGYDMFFYVDVDDRRQACWIMFAYSIAGRFQLTHNHMTDLLDKFQEIPWHYDLEKEGYLDEYLSMTTEEFVEYVRVSNTKPENVDFWV